MLPVCLVRLIKSFLPGPEPWVPPYIRQLDTMRIEDWEDVAVVCAYGDYR